MDIAIQQEQSQKLILTTSMRQSLEVLQLSSFELTQYVQDAALSNPLLEVASPNLDALSFEDLYEREARDVEILDSPIQDGFDSYSRSHSIDNIPERCEPSFTEYLSAQLRQSSLIDDSLLDICLFLIHCLNGLGYLECPLEDLALELGRSIFEIEQALLAIQMLDPPGVGARSLSECLLLQLAQSNHFNGTTVRMVQEGLSLLASHNYAEMSQMFHVSIAEIQQSAKIVTSLNPIPSQGFRSEGQIYFSAPDAIIRYENGNFVLELNERVLPRVTVNQDYLPLLQNAENAEVRQYVKKKYAEANSLIESINGRCSTIKRLVAALISLQREYFISGTDLKPLTMSTMAEVLHVSTSTVSRTVQDKSVLFNGKIIPLCTFFSSPIYQAGGVMLSSKSVKKKLLFFVEKEDSSAPLSDEALRLALNAVGIEISRRTVAKYRAELGIPSASQRKDGY